MNLLIAEDDAAIAESLRKNFVLEGCHVSLASDGQEALRLSGSVEFDVVILDWRMPGLTGYEVCQQMRDRGVRSPILMLTALADIDRKVAALEGGADDYLTKPFSFRELLARVRSLRRRYDVPVQEMTFADLSLDLDARTVRGPLGSIDLTDREYALLRHFLAHRGSIQSKADLTRSVWRSSDASASNVVEVTVRHLRRKLNSVTSAELIRSCYGEGYVFVAL